MHTKIMMCDCVSDLFIMLTVAKCDKQMLRAVILYPCCPKAQLRKHQICVTCEEEISGGTDSAAV